jgi:hypothetical protein
MESAQAHQVDHSCQNTSEALVNKGCWSMVSPLCLGETREEAGMYHLEGADKRPTDTGYCSLLRFQQGSGHNRHLH